MAQQNRPPQGAGELVNGLDLQALGQLFATDFDMQGIPRFFFAPGWVDLMGCANLGLGGWSLSLPVDRGVVVAAAPRTDGQVRVRLLTEEEVQTFDLANPPATSPDHWLNVLFQVICQLQARNVALVGADLLISSNLPPGLTLKNLMALEEALSLALYSLSGADVYRASSLSLAGQAWLKNLDSGELKPIPLNLPDVSLVLTDSRVQPGLMETLGPQRSMECRYGLDLLRVVQPACHNLDDFGAELAQEEHRCIEDKIIRKRLRHCLGENARVKPLVEALQVGDFVAMRRLLADSRKSLRENFELSCPEWDTLAVLAEQLPGVVAAQILTGGDFEGCTLHWVKSSAAETFETSVTEAYESIFDRTPYVSLVQPGAIAQELLLPNPAWV